MRSVARPSVFISLSRCNTHSTATTSGGVECSAPCPYCGRSPYHCDCSRFPNSIHILGTCALARRAAEGRSATRFTQTSARACGDSDSADEYADIFPISRQAIEFTQRGLTACESRARGRDSASSHTGRCVCKQSGTREAAMACTAGQHSQPARAPSGRARGCSPSPCTLIQQPNSRAVGRRMPLLQRGKRRQVASLSAALDLNSTSGVEGHAARSQTHLYAYGVIGGMRGIAVQAPNQCHSAAGIESGLVDILSRPDTRPGAHNDVTCALRTPSAPIWRASSLLIETRGFSIAESANRGQVAA